MRFFVFFLGDFNETGFDSFRGDFKVFSMKKIYRVFFYIDSYYPCICWRIGTNKSIS